MKSLPLIVLLTVTANAQLRVSADGHYLYEKQTNLPVYLNGESAWCLFTALTYTQVDTFFQNCQQYSINFLQTMLIEDGFRAASPNNTNGDSPFTGANFTTPRTAYFTHCDSVIALAKTYGIYLHCYISYLGSNASEGWQTEIGAASEADMESWGEYIGARYKDSTNIVWGISGDTDPTTWRAKLDSMSWHLYTVDTNHLLVPRDEPFTQTADHWAGRSWLKVEYVYPYWGPANYNPERIYAMGWSIYTSARPGFLEEAWYENEHTSGGSTYPTDAQLRRQMYYAPLSGLIGGQVFGNCPIWHFSQGSNPVCGSGDFRTWLDSQGHISTQVHGDVIRYRRFWTFVPDEVNAVLTAGQGTGATLAVCAYASDGSSIIVYTPDSKTLTVTSAGLAGDSTYAWWYEVDDGTTTFIGAQTKASHDYASGGERVLVLDGKSATHQFPAPGLDTTATQTTVRYMRAKR